MTKRYMQTTDQIHKKANKIRNRIDILKLKTYFLTNFYEKIEYSKFHIYPTKSTLIVSF